MTSKMSNTDKHYPGFWKRSDGLMDRGGHLGNAGNEGTSGVGGFLMVRGGVCPLETVYFCKDGCEASNIAATSLI